MIDWKVELENSGHEIYYERTNERTNEWTNERMNERMNKNFLNIISIKSE